LYNLDFHSCSETIIVINRDNILNSSFDAIMNLPTKYLKKPLRVEYIGETGLDVGGFLRDFLYNLSREIVNPNYLLLKYSSTDSYELEINPKSNMSGPEHLKYFKYIGRILGLAIINEQYFPLYFTRPFYKRLIGEELEYSDLKLVDPKLYKHLNELLENENVEDYCLTFTVEELDCFKYRNVIELKPNGANIDVTNENKHEYVELISKYKLCNTNDEKQFNAIKEGFYEIIPYQIGDILNDLDLKYLLSGVNEIDINDWKKYTKYEGYTEYDITIINFWKCISEFSNEERSLVLLFTTGSSQVPITGFKDLQSNGKIERFTIRKSGNKTDLPVSHTCFNCLDLPPYSSINQLKRKLLLAINEGISGFQRD